MLVVIRHYCNVQNRSTLTQQKYIDPITHKAEFLKIVPKRIIIRSIKGKGAESHPCSHEG